MSRQRSQANVPLWYVVLVVMLNLQLGHVMATGYSPQYGIGCVGCVTMTAVGCGWAAYAAPITARSQSCDQLFDTT